jgi:hypothetical protein
MIRVKIDTTNTYTWPTSFLFQTIGTLLSMLYFCWVPPPFYYKYCIFGRIHGMARILLLRNEKCTSWSFTISRREWITFLKLERGGGDPTKIQHWQKSSNRLIDWLVFISPTSVVFQLYPIIKLYDKSQNRYHEHINMTGLFPILCRRLDKKWRS